MEPTLKQLRAMTSVAECGSFTLAAERLHLTQSALSVLIRELESRTEARLFDRSPRGVKLTEIGKALYPRAKRVLDELAQALSVAAGVKERRMGHFKLVAPQILSCTLVPTAIMAYRRRFPGVSVELSDAIAPEVQSRVLAGAAHFGIADGNMPIARDLEATPLFESLLMLACRADHPLSRRKRLRWTDLAGQPYVAAGSEGVARLSAAIAARGREVHFDVKFEAAFFTTRLALIGAGLGVSVVPACAKPLMQIHKLRMLSIIDPEIRVPFVLVRRRQESLSPAALDFIELLKDLAPPRP